MRLIGAFFILFILSLNNGYCITPADKSDIKISKEVSLTVDNFQHSMDNPMMLKGNPNSWWNRWGRKTFAFTGVFIAGVGVGVGIGSVVPGIGTTSGALVGVVGGLLAGVAVVRNMTGPE
jgi:hypothetical protein